MKKTILLSTLVLFIVSLQSVIYGQTINVCLAITGDSLVINYKTTANFNVAPDNFWNSQVITIRYPKATPVTFGTPVSVSPTVFPWVQDPSTPGAGVDGGDGFYYVKFLSNNTLTVFNFTANNSIKMLRIKLIASATVSFDIITSNTWTTANNGDVAINSGISGNVFGNITTDCGNRTYTPKVVCISCAEAQIGMKLGADIGTKTPSAVLDLGTGSQGLLLPKVALTSKTSQTPLVGGTFSVAAPAGMTVYNTATVNDVTPGIYYSDGTTWNQNEEIGVINGLSKTAEIVELGGILTKATTITQNDFNFILKPSTSASGMTFAKGNNFSNNRIFMPTDGLEIQSNEPNTSTKPIIQVMNTSQNERFRVQSDGKVGIGTNAPTHLLHLNGGAEGIETVLLNLQANAGGTITPSTGVAIRFSPTNPGGFNLRGAEISGVNQGANNIDLLFRTTTGTSSIFEERMRIKSTGEVGIGTSSPSSTFHTDGTIAVTTGSTMDNSVILASGNIITLPTASTSPGRIYIIRNTNTGTAPTGNISVSSVINYNASTAASFTLTTAQGAITVISDGTSWYRVR